MNAPVQDNTYQGWKNYATFSIQLYIDNEQDQYEFWTKRTAFLMSPQGYDLHKNEFDAKLFNAEDVAKFTLDTQLKTYFNNKSPKYIKEPFNTLLQGTLDSVYWYEIAEELISTYKENQNANRGRG